MKSIAEIVAEGSKQKPPAATIQTAPVAPVLVPKKSVAERRQHAHHATSADITMQPPDKYTNGDAIGFTPYFTTQFGLRHSPV